ncbi:sugar ABC transporter substrate-binding protein [Fonticella tunisiensis]|uniref:Maltodextrin-binding protein n=1 Tax=Fonticella tunisiensis TaxID=1096341 RepID=A0A4R7KBS8_9CLOT|nr:maltose ABC transporter substrate-binding protein [Fonticella tunisiensis]TDT51998.1 maltose/maltodextrin transport system substrate-binding protein/arabinogalactan oligomer/maltooligosaccharide transport system substrate-binding protein [Fonticella tunisiensis]
MKIKKTLALLLSLVMAAGLFSACGKSNKPTNAEKKDVTITVWHQYLPEVQKAIEDAYASFTQETGIKVQFVKQEELSKKLEVGSQSNELPDLVAGPNDWVGKYSIMGGIVSVDGLIDKKVTDGLMESTVKGFTYKGKLYGIPATFETVTLIYNKDLIKEAPKTTDELIAKAKELTKDGKYGFLIPPTDAYFNSAFFYGAKGGYLDADGNPILNKAENLEAAKILTELGKLYPKDLNHQLVSQLFKDGKAAMMINGPWELGGIKEKKINYGLAKIPALSFNKSDASPFMGVQGMMMTSAAKDKEAAAKVMEFFANEKVAKALAKTGGYMPANKKIYEDSEIKNNPDVVAFSEQAKVATAMPNVPEMGAMWDPISKALQEIVVLKEAPDKVFEKYQKAAEEAIKNMK